MAQTLFTDLVTLISASWLNDVDAGTYNSLSSVAGTNTITATGPTTVTAYAANQHFYFIPANTNTGATTLNISSIGAKNVFWNNAACVGGELKQSVPVLVFYDGTRFQIVGPVVSAAQGATSVLLSTGTAATSATLDFTSLTPYQGIYVVIEQIVPVTNGAALTVQISEDNGGSWKGGATNYKFASQTVDSAAASGTICSTGATALTLVNTISSSANQGCSGWVLCHNFNGTKEKQFTYNMTRFDGTNWDANYGGGTYNATAAAANGLRFAMSSGNISTGTIKVYGIRIA